ncbi:MULTISPECIES: hypothetical protein [unclassified Bartonella]|uniref:hypothetical protein n=1 Tax=unclassified Bartonella TaxID=2645622 RepID=UPI0035CEF73B
MRALVCGGGVAGWFIGGGKTMEGAGHHPVAWSDTESMLDNKMRLRGKRSSSTDKEVPTYKKARSRGKRQWRGQVVIQWLGVTRKACWITK